MMSQKQTPPVYWEVVLKVALLRDFYFPKRRRRVEVRFISRLAADTRLRLRLRKSGQVQAEKFTASTCTMSNQP